MWEIFCPKTHRGSSGFKLGGLIPKLAIPIAALPMLLNYQTAIQGYHLCKPRNEITLTLISKSIKGVLKAHLSADKNDYSY